MIQRHKIPRRFPRVRARRPVLVRLLADEQREMEEITRTGSVGLGGCMFESPQEVGYGSLLELMISFPEGVARTDGRVVWEKRRLGGKVDVGVEFLSLGPLERKLLATTIRKGKSGASSRPSRPR